MTGQIIEFPRRWRLRSDMRTPRPATPSVSEQRKEDGYVLLLSEAARLWNECQARLRELQASYPCVDVERCRAYVQAHDRWQAACLQECGG